MQRTLSRSLRSFLPFQGGVRAATRSYRGAAAATISGAGAGHNGRESTTGGTTTIAQRRFSTPTTPPFSRFAVIDHAAPYETAMAALHGQQLELAKVEGYGKDDAPFDPFAMDDEIDAMLEQALQKTGHESATAAAVPPEDVVVHDKDEDAAFAVPDLAADATHPNDNNNNTGMPTMYNNDGSLRWKPSQLATLRAGYPSGGWFAVVQLAGSQYKVTTDDVLIVNLLKPVKTFKVGSIHTLTDILLLGSTHTTVLGMPTVPGAQVDVLVEEITKDAKIIVFKKRRRKHSKRKNGFRRQVTMLRILDIRPPASVVNHFAGRPRLDPADEDDRLIPPLPEKEEVIA